MFFGKVDSNSDEDLELWRFVAYIRSDGNFTAAASHETMDMALFVTPHGSVEGDAWVVYEPESEKGTDEQRETVTAFTADFGRGEKRKRDDASPSQPPAPTPARATGGGARQNAERVQTPGD